MGFYFYKDDGTCKELTAEELREHMTEYQIAEAIEAKRNDPNEEISYMTVGGVIVVDF